MKKVLLSTSIVAILLASSCKKTTTPNDPPLPINNFMLLSIKSTNQPTGNSCNMWDLQQSLTTTPFTYGALRTADNIVSAPGLLGQTTMTNQSSAWDKVNNMYAVSLGTSVLFYNLTTSTPAAPYNLTISSTNMVEAMEANAGKIYFITKDKNLSVWTTGAPYAPTASTVLNAIPVTVGTKQSNMSRDNANNLYFISDGKLFKYAVTGTAAALATGYPVTVSSIGLLNNGVEYNTADNKIYAIQRTGTVDAFVRIDPITGTATTLPITLTYTTDYSRISSALDYSTNRYYVVASNGHNSDTHTLITIDNINTTPAINTLISASAASKYVFGLQLKDY